jgi:hypothetical protein
MLVSASYAYATDHEDVFLEDFWCLLACMSNTCNRNGAGAHERTSFDEQRYTRETVQRLH